MSYKNLADLHRGQAKQHGDRTVIRFKRDGEWRELNWNQYHGAALACAAGLIDAGLQIGDRVGMVSENRAEWLMADMGLLAAGAVNVPAHVTQSGKQITDQFAHAEVSWVFASNQEQFDKIKNIRDEIPAVKKIITFEDIPGADASWAGYIKSGKKLLEKIAQEVDNRVDSISGENLATIMYTSGTTGNSKGVMLTHGNLLSNAWAMKENAGVDENSILLNWLPFSHIYGRLVDHYMHLAVGSTLCLAVSQETLIEDLKDIQPTHFSGVPRFYEKVMTAVESADPEEEKRKLRDVFGPRIKWLNSGGAPLPVAIHQKYMDAGLMMLQGYGLTETSPVISFSTEEQHKVGSAGVAVPGVEIKIAPDGEICSRGPNVMKGYWKNPEATAESIVDGWFHTGDLGELDDEGFLTITGRKKDLTVLSNGKKVVPTHVEGLMVFDPCIDQAVVCGEGRNFLTALVVPNYDNVRAMLKGKIPANATDADLATNEVVYDLIMDRTRAALSDLANYEQVRKIVLRPVPFTQEAEEMTVSLKLRRGIIIKKYAELIEGMYR